MAFYSVCICFVLVPYPNYALANKKTCDGRFTAPANELWTRQLDNYSLSLDPAITVTAADHRYDDLRPHRNNVNMKANTAYIVMPRKTSEVVSVLQQAVANNVRPTVRSGGHCYEDFWSNNTKGILIDLSAMRNIYRSPNDSTIWMEAGTRIEDVYNRLHNEFDLWAPVGTCFDLGVGGHVLGGGYGYWVRKYGLFCDYAYAFEMVHVTADRRVETVLVSRESTDEKEANLYWSLRGGGQQNFGIVTRIGFRDFPRPPRLIYTYHAHFYLTQNFTQSTFINFLDKYVRFFVAHSTPDDEYCDLFAHLQLKRDVNGEHMNLRLIVNGDKRELAETFLHYVGLDPSEFTCEKMSAYRLSQTTATRDDYSTVSSYIPHSAYMVSAMPLHQLETLWHYFTNPNDSFIYDGWVQLGSYGCAMGKIPENASAYVHRRAVIKMQYQTGFVDDMDSESHRNWSRSLYRSMYGEAGPVPDDVMDGCYVGYPDGELINGQRLYYKNNYDRLQLTKTQWDPLNIFHHRQSIELPPKT